MTVRDKIFISYSHEDKTWRDRFHVDAGSAHKCCIQAMVGRVDFTRRTLE